MGSCLIAGPVFQGDVLPALGAEPSTLLQMWKVMMQQLL